MLNVKWGIDLCFCFYSYEYDFDPASRSNDRMHQQWCAHKGCVFCFNFDVDETKANNGNNILIKSKKKTKQNIGHAHTRYKWIIMPTKNSNLITRHEWITDKTRKNKINGAKENFENKSNKNLTYWITCKEFYFLDGLFSIADQREMICMSMHQYNIIVSRCLFYPGFVLKTFPFRSLEFVFIQQLIITSLHTT